MRTDRRLRLRSSDKDAQRSYSVLTGPVFAVGTSVSYTRLLGGCPGRVLRSERRNHPLSSLDFITRDHDLEFTDDAAIFVRYDSKIGIHYSAPALWTRPNQDDGVKSLSFQPSFDILGRGIIECRVDSHHPLVNIVGTVMMAKESPLDHEPTFSAKREAADDADSGSR